MLRGAGVEVVIVDPKRMRHFAKAAGRLAKNDPIDAEMIAWFGEMFPGEAQAHDPARQEVDQIVPARRPRAAEGRIVNRASMARRPRAKAQGAMPRPGPTGQAGNHHCRQDRKQPSVRPTGRDHPERARPRDSRRRPDRLGARARPHPQQAAAALLGAAPFDDDSGERKGARHIKGGRRKLRKLLYMPVMGAATQHNPVLKAYYQRLRAKGKEAKVALIACMRKLIVILNTMLARDETWRSPPRAAA